MEKLERLCELIEPTELNRVEGFLTLKNSHVLLLCCGTRAVHAEIIICVRVCQENKYM